MFGPKDLVMCIESAPDGSYFGKKGIVYEVFSVTPGGTAITLVGDTRNSKNLVERFTLYKKYVEPAPVKKQSTWDSDEVAALIMADDSLLEKAREALKLDNASASSVIRVMISDLYSKRKHKTACIVDFSKVDISDVKEILEN